MPLTCPTCGQQNDDAASSCRACGRIRILGHFQLKPPPPVAFVGRQRELSILQGKLEEAAAGYGNLVVLVGEAGVGKTRLAREYALRCHQSGLLVLSGVCFEGEWQPPFGPWIEAMGRYARSVQPQRLQREPGPLASPLAQLVPEVRTDPPEIPPPTPEGADRDRLRLYDSTAQFLLTLAQDRPVLLALDDLHWADLDSLRLLRYLDRLLGQSRLLVVGAYQEPEFGVNSRHPLLGTLALLHHETGYERVSLRG